MKDSYTAQELAEILGVTVRAVRKRMNGGPCVQVRNRNGGKDQKLYIHTGLPKDILDAIAEHDLKKAYDMIERTEMEAVRGMNPDLREGINPSPTAGALIRCPHNGERKETVPVPAKPQPIVPDRSNEVGLAKHRLVMAWREIMISRPHSQRGQATEAFLAAYRTGQLFPAVHRTLGDMSKATLYRMDKTLRDSGGDYLAIADGRGGWKKHGTTRWKPRILPPEAQEIFLQCYLHPNKPTVELAVRAARITLERNGMRGDYCDGTFRRWLKDFEARNQHVIVMARDGEKAYRDKVGAYITRDSAVLKVGQVLVADGHDLNFTILHPTTGKPARLKLVLFFDWASRMPVGWQIMPTENVIAIQAALRNSILTLGKIPQAVYLDNGKSFKARIFTETNPDLADLAGLYARLGIATAFALPYNARSKVIERFFLSINEQFERIMPTYCGASIEDKPAWMLRNERLHQLWHQARTQGWVPNVREAAYLLGIYFRWYGEQDHDGIGGRKPLDVLQEGLGPGVDVSDLNYQFMWSKRVKTSRCRVTLFGIDYESDCLHGMGEDVIIRYETSNLAVLYCYTLGGQYLGEALPVQAMHPLASLFADEVSVDQVKAALARGRKLMKQTRQNLEAIGAPGGMTDGLKALPWNRRESLKVVSRESVGAGLKPAHTEETDQAEVKRLELIVSRTEEELQIERAQKPRVDRPEFFQSEASRYEWCFMARHKTGAELCDEDDAFMVYFEKTEEFGNNYRQRYADLLELYAMYGSELSRDA